MRICIEESTYEGTPIEILAQLRALHFDAGTFDGAEGYMLYTLLASCFLSHLNNTPKPDSVQEPGFVIFRGCLLVRPPLWVL